MRKIASEIAIKEKLTEDKDAAPFPPVGFTVVTSSGLLSVPSLGSVTLLGSSVGVVIEGGQVAGQSAQLQVDLAPGTA